ncbi:hypothetical protein B0H14DRAFT_2684712 [Mycena olivaceomarginata]|nr:hypothetical protein B0H14DRAFT_2684712 [Mycena olivaceomarginata]
MAAPFIYVPEDAADTAAADTTAYQNPYFRVATPQKRQSPFLPPSPFLYPSSPYLGPSDGAGPSDAAKAFDPNSVLWPEDAQYESAHTPSWAPLTRQRTTSWHASAAGSPFIPPKSPAFLHAQSYSNPPGHKKSKSWGNANATPPWAGNAFPNTPSPKPPIQVHPWLNGDTPSPIFFFDLAPKSFAPQRAVSTTPPQGTLLGEVEMREPAFHPPLTALRILHPRLPFWPIDLALPPGVPAAQAPPISLGDVLAAIHHALHVKIAPADWATLSSEDQQHVSGTFTQRCRREAVRSKVPQAQLRDRELEERNQGVKRVDFLLGQTVFKGLVRVPGDPEGCVRMVTA